MQSLFLIMRIIIIIDIGDVNSLGGQADPVGIDSAWETLDATKKRVAGGRGRFRTPNGERLISGDISERRDGVGKQAVRVST
jgi:hypothetical protein